MKKEESNIQKPKRNLFLSAWNNLQYLFTASMDSRRFGMINTLMPKSPDNLSLKKAIFEANQKDKKILDLGCGNKAQALIDLRNMGVQNLYGVDIFPSKKEKKGVSLKYMNLNKPFELVDDYCDGVVYSSYVLNYLPANSQLEALREIDRITAKGSRGYLGPFQPKKLVDTEFAQAYPDYKNPLKGFVDEMNSKGEGKWKLTHNFQYNSKTFSSNTIDEWYYRKSIPFFNAYILYGRNILRKFLPKITVKRDRKIRLSLEYFITFTKS